MKPINLSILVAATTFVFLTGCYKDKGNYVYTPINEIGITSDSTTINVMLPDRLKINITINQTKAAAEGLSYQWVMYPNNGTPLTRRTLDTTEDLDVVVTEDPGSYLVDLFVKDRKTQVEFQKRFSVNLLTALSEGWIVVEEKAGGCDFSLVSPTDRIFRNVYSQVNGGRLLPSGTFRIPEIRTNRGIQSVYVLTPQGGEFLNFANFLKVSDYSSFFFQAPNPPAPQEYFLNGDAETLLDNGKPYSRNLNGIGTIKLNLPPLGNYYLAPFELYASTTSNMWYDTINQKFLRQDINNFNLLGFASSPSDPFDMNNIGKRILFADISATNSYYAFFQNNDDDSLFAFNFRATGGNMPLARYDGLEAPGLATAKKFVMSKTLPYLYYVNDNSIYKLDVLAKTAAPIYSFPAGTEIRAMKLYRNYKTNDANNNKMIAVATLEGGNQGKLYYFPIAATGNFSGNTFSKVFDGFGKINEITFKSLK